MKSTQEGKHAPEKNPDFYVELLLGSLFCDVTQSLACALKDNAGGRKWVAKGASCVHRCTFDVSYVSYIHHPEHWARRWRWRWRRKHGNEAPWLWSCSLVKSTMTKSCHLLRYLGVSACFVGHYCRKERVEWRESHLNGKTGVWNHRLDHNNTIFRPRDKTPCGFDFGNASHERGALSK